MGNGIAPQASAGTWHDLEEKQATIGDREAGVQAQNIFSNGGKNYRTVGRWMSGILLITNQVGIGILSLPGTLQTLGIVPGVIAIIGIGLLSTYTAYVLLQFYRAHPHVVNMADMAKVVGGRPLEAVVAVGLLIKFCFTCASATVTLSVALNSITDNAICTVGFMACAFVAFWLLSLPRRFSFVAKMGIPGTLSVVIPVFIVIISLGVEPPQGAEPGSTIERNVIGYPSFRDGLGACLNIAYAYAGNAGFVTYMAEMEDPSHDFLPALIILQGFSIPLYILAAVAIYCLAGQYTTSPSLGSAPVIPAKVSYGILLPGMLVTGLIFGHSAVKYLYVLVMRRLRATDQLTATTFKSWSAWVGCASVFWICVFVLANAVPIFDSILAISSAALIAWFTFGISGVFWLHLNRGLYFSNWRKMCLTTLNLFTVVIAVFMNTAGLWAAILGLMDTFDSDDNKIRGPFSCADNGIL
ncbi:hypothetical protein ACRALDRAFT_2098624 [Sodiomyces alcalophilus JCM 7366]|uniref:uncharacterized protein n=1 Tax=Sodiomyces alcalophilus JCM 7366 TaxID=591952 RepID=UPI0039B5E1C0